jgi:hypothetical protein
LVGVVTTELEPDVLLVRIPVHVGTEYGDPETVVEPSLSGAARSSPERSAYLPPRRRVCVRLEDAVDVSVERFDSNPLVTPDSDPRIGSNINGPSVVCVPDWVSDPLGRYYCYFAHHDGDYIRLAYADDVRGPWTVHTPGTLHIGATQFDGHIASPDVHVDHGEERFRMYFHGCCGPFDHPAGEFGQATDAAVSDDGVDFDATGAVLGDFYFRVWSHRGTHYAVDRWGHLYRSEDPLAPFERRHQLIPRCRHFAVDRIDPDTVRLFLTRDGDRPERVQVGALDLSRPVDEWRIDPHPPETVLWPTESYEGGDLPIESSEEGAADAPVRALRDPAVFDAEDGTYLFYSTAGERGIAGAEIVS